MYLEKLNSKNRELLKNIKDLKVYLESQKDSLDSEKIDLEKVVKMQILQKQQNEAAQKEKDNFLKLTEVQYQKQLQDKAEVQKRASEIRARIFEIIGVPEAPTFGEAYALAQEIEKTTGVRPAFLLAVLTQESNIGKNVGQCYLRNKDTGEGISVAGNTIQKVMKPSRDIQPFLTITQELGRDPYNTPVSCPIPSIGGYGGAMGPAQFIPATWLGYRDRIRSITGKTPDPWNIRDAFLAAALYLSDYGAKSQTANQEWRAAMIYFSGSTNTRYRFYGDSVAAIARQYAEDIKSLNQ
ncbi:MAG: lytic murein transglycosylase [Candidatus Nealsonbacteria bacterium]|nr:lytic murein transglycosylase [Candidatus Nealsonbacteria bacterium]